MRDINASNSNIISPFDAAHSDSWQVAAPSVSGTTASSAVKLGNAASALENSFDRDCKYGEVKEEKWVEVSFTIIIPSIIINFNSFG